mgnify:CR=1 FL=1|tara:strand:+ start:5441 stop:5833 length:393 start_codon:yes stop_codon:yes gene_type:complete
MASALTALANASLVLTLPAAGTTTDAATGNVISNTTTQTLSAYLKQSQPITTDFDGVDVEGDVFEGYFTSGDPSSLVSRGTIGTLAFGGQAAQRCIVLDLDYPYGATGLVGSTLRSALGASVRVIRYQQA